jgi:hypothetical protein
MTAARLESLFSPQSQSGQLQYQLSVVLSVEETHERSQYVLDAVLDVLVVHDLAVCDQVDDRAPTSPSFAA